MLHGQELWLGDANYCVFKGLNCQKQKWCKCQTTKGCIRMFIICMELVAAVICMKI